MHVPEADIGKTYRCLLICSLAFNRTERNIRTQFLYDNSIFLLGHLQVREGSRVHRLANVQAFTYLAYRPSTFYPANVQTILPGEQAAVGLKNPIRLS